MTHAAYWYGKLALNDSAHYKWHPIAYTHVRVALKARAHKGWH